MRKTTFLRLCPGVLSAVLLTACSSLSPSPVDRVAKVDALIAEQQFLEAVDQIVKSKPSDDNYQQLIDRLPVIEAQSERYVEAVLEKTGALQEDDQWQKAKETFTDALDRLPKQTELREKLAAQYEVMLENRDKYIANQRLRLNVRLGRYLLQEGNYLEKIHEANPSSLSNSWEYSGYKRKRREIGRFLAEAGEDALSRKKYYSARSYLELSQELLPDEQTQMTLEKANEKIAAFKTLEKQEQEDNYQQLLYRFQTLRAAEDFSVAKEVLDTLLEIKPDNKQLLAEQSALNSAIALEVDQAVLEGEARYSTGEVHEALIIWKHAIALAPENVELQQRIERAERFLENYQSLQQASDEDKQ